MPTRTLPDATWPKTPNDSDSSAPGSDPYSPSGAAQQPSVLQETLAGSGSVIPIAYGRVRLGGLAPIYTSLNGSLVICVVWCMGEIQSISVKINDEAIPAGVTVTSYLGTTTQGVDPTLAAAIPGYTDNLVYVDPKYGSVGIAYSVVRIPSGIEEVNGIPRITADIQGRKVYCCVANGYVYSANPANVIADLIRDPILGMRRQVRLSSQTDLQTICNEVMGDGAKRREVNLALTNAQDIVQWLETLRAYAGCMLFFEGNEAVLIPNRPVASSVVVTADQILKGSLSVTKNPTAPNVVRVAYTDITAEPWRTNYALAIHPDVSNGTAAWNEESISMPGYQNYGQAFREATERLNAYRYSDMDIRFTMFDEGLRLIVGTVVSLTHPIGFTGALFRVETINAAGPGSWAITASTYSSSVYSDAAPTAPPFPNIKPPNSSDPGITDPPGSALTLTEVFVVLSDGTPVSKINASWTGTSQANFSKYEIWWKPTSASGWNTDFSATTSWLSPQVTLGSYTVQVRNVATDGAVGAWLEGTINISGKNGTGWAAPAAPSANSGSMFIEFTWSYPSGAEDVAYAEIWVATSNSFSAAVLIAKVAYPGTKYALFGLPPGTCRYFWVKFADTSGNITGTYPTAPNGGVERCTPAAGTDMLEYLSGQIANSHLTATLNTQITRASEDANQALIEVGTLSTEVYGEYYVKIDVGGRVAGYGLSNDATEGSLFLVKVDRFAIGGVGVTTKYPFIVAGGIVYIDSAVIRDATIENAKIANLTLQTGKLGYNSISSGTGATLGTYTFSSSTNTTYTYNHSTGIAASNLYGVLVVVDFVVVQNSRTTDSVGTPLDYVACSGYSITLTFSGAATGSKTWTVPDNQPSAGPRSLSRAAFVTPGSLSGNLYMNFSFTSKASPGFPVVGAANQLQDVAVAMFGWSR